MPGADAGTGWAAASTAFSAFLYLLDFATNISTLRTYYVYEYLCPHASLASSAVRDPICSAIRSNSAFRSAPFQFWDLLGCLILSHLTYTIVFWLTLPPHKHPLRLAYFLPLVHVYQLLQLLVHAFSTKDLKELMKRQAESTNLFNVIGASMETAPQFYVQFMAAMRLGAHVKGSLDPNLRAQKIPTNLIISLVASLLSGSYNTSMAVLSLIKTHMSLARRVYFYFVIGCHSLAAMLVRALCLSTPAIQTNTTTSILCWSYYSCDLLMVWLFIDWLLQNHHHNGQEKRKCLRVAHSFVLAMMTTSIGPLYVIVKFSKRSRSCLIVWGTLIYILLDVAVFCLLLFLSSHIQELKTPCIKYGPSVEENQYLTCKATIIALFLSILIFILTALQFLYLQNSNNARILPSTATNNACDSHYKPNSLNAIIINGFRYISKDSNEESSHEKSAMAFFTWFLFIVCIIFIQKSQKLCILKR